MILLARSAAAIEAPLIGGRRITAVALLYVSTKVRQERTEKKG
jgi:hypothetical protein